MTQAPAALAGPACSQAVGSRQAEEYVRECLEVSPATHPPCNVANPCALILDEVARGCAMLPSGSAPAFCARRERRNVGRDE